MSILVPSLPQPPLDPQALAHMATALFQALPGAAPAAVPGVQAPVNVAPAGSPLASPAGLGPAVPGTPIAQGQIPGSQLLPAAPTTQASLAHRVPALLPHADAGHGVPDLVQTALPGYEPRFGAAASGVSGLPSGAGEPATATPTADPLDALARLPFAHPAVPVIATPTQGRGHPSTEPSTQPQFYFADAVVLPGGYTTPAHPAQARSTREHRTSAPWSAAPAPTAWDVHAVRRDFPTLQERVNGRPLAWLDNAATTHKPQAVIDRLAHFYRHENSNIHRAAHTLAARATDAYEGAREKVRAFLHAPEVDEVIFVRGTTEAINLVAKTWGAQHIGQGDEIIVSHLEHHANIVPWQQLCAATGARLRVIPVDDTGQVQLDAYRQLLNPRTKLVAVTQVSNALGTVVPVREIVALAHQAGAKALVDGAQSVSHLQVDVQALGADFFVFSGHKIFGPTGIGVLWGRREVLEDMPPWQGGGNMIADVSFERTVYQPIPNKFEAGTGNIADAVGLGAALDYVQRLGLGRIAQYEHALLEYGTQALGAIPGVRLVGTAADKASVLSFVLAGYSTTEVGLALNDAGIAVRTGHHCAQPILRRFGVEATVRPSLAFYNTTEEIDRLAQVVQRLAGRRR